jgi:hypothetical protein
MELFVVLKFYLKTFEVTFLAYTVTRLLFLGGKNTDSGNSGTLMLTLINCWNKFSCWKDLIFLERNLIVGGKNLKLGEN